MFSSGTPVIDASQGIPSRKGDCRNKRSSFCSSSAGHKLVAAVGDHSVDTMGNDRGQRLQECRGGFYAGLDQLHEGVLRWVVNGRKGIRLALCNLPLSQIDAEVADESI
jgi:hypothetical protein